MIDIQLDNWLPLESNTTVVNKYIENLGVTEMLKYFDVVSFDLEDLSYIPQPILAALFTYPDLKQISDHYQQLVDVQKDKQVNLFEDVYFMEQTARNACGTVGILHALANLIKDNDYLFQQDGYIHQFYNDTINMNPEERANYLTNSKALNQMHIEAVHEGSAPVNENTDVNHHFITFIWKNGHVLELDGRKPYPLVHDACIQEDFLPTLLKVLKQNFLNQAPNELRYNLMVLSTDFN